MFLAKRRVLRHGTLSALLPATVWHIGFARGHRAQTAAPISTIPRERIAPNQRGELVLDLRQNRFKPLRSVGGAMSIEVSGDRFPIMVMHREKETFNALSSRGDLQSGTQKQPALRGNPYGGNRLTSTVTTPTKSAPTITRLKRYQTIYHPKQEKLTITYTS